MDRGERESISFAEPHSPDLLAGFARLTYSPDLLARLTRQEYA